MASAGPAVGGTLVRLPKEVADELLASESAIRVRPVRSGGVAELVSDSAVVGATLVSLLQGPNTLNQLHAAVHTWLLRGRSREGFRSISVRGPRGSARVEVTNDSDLEELASVLARTILAPRVDQSSDGAEGPSRDRR
jgi:hypothetical protein